MLTHLNCYSVPCANDSWAGTHPDEIPYLQCVLNIDLLQHEPLHCITWLQNQVWDQLPFKPRSIKPPNHSLQCFLNPAVSWDMRLLWQRSSWLEPSVQHECRWQDQLLSLLASTDSLNQAKWLVFLAASSSELTSSRHSPFKASLYIYSVKNALKLVLLARKPCLEPRFQSQTHCVSIFCMLFTKISSKYFLFKWKTVPLSFPWYSLASSMWFDILCL